MFEEIGSVEKCGAECFAESPTSDVCVVSREEDIGDRYVAKVGRACVLWVFEEGSLERFFADGVGISEDTGDQSCHSVEDGECSGFATGKHKVTEGYLAIHEVGTDAFIDAFVSSANHDQAGQFGEFVCDLLSKGCSVWTHQDHGGALGHDGACIFDGACEGFRLHHHPIASTVGRIVDETMFAFAIFAKVERGKMEQAFFCGSSNHTDTAGAGNHFRKKC